MTPASPGDAVKVLMVIRQARDAVQHSITDGGGLTAKLRQLAIHDAPPNWGGAWDSIRVQTANNTLTMLRNELHCWVDSQP